jgi:hypothetical protein
MTRRALSPRYLSRVLAELKCMRGGELLCLLFALLPLDDKLFDFGLVCIRVIIVVVMAMSCSGGFLREPMATKRERNLNGESHDSWNFRLNIW